MLVESLNIDSVPDFVEYCKAIRMDIDNSYLYDEDLDVFKPNDENPTYIVRNHSGEIIAAASLILDDYHRRGKRARFRIFYSVEEDIAFYKVLFQALLQHTNGLEKLFLFVPKANTNLIDFIEQMHFDVERYSYLLIREDLEAPEYLLPVDYSIRTFMPGIDEGIWSEVRNAGFAKLQGSETPMTPDMVAEMVSNEGYIEDGMKILFHLGRPVGVVHGEADSYENVPAMLIATLAIIPEYQGKGLGRVLLRAALQFAKEKSYKRTILSVNGENDRAKALYVQEGFKEAEAFTCYQYQLK